MKKFIQYTFSHFLFPGAVEGPSLIVEMYLEYMLTNLKTGTAIGIQLRNQMQVDSFYQAHSNNLKGSIPYRMEKDGVHFSSPAQQIVKNIINTKSRDCRKSKAL